MKMSLFTILENAAEKAKNSGSMIALFIPRKDGIKIQQKFTHINGDMVKPKDMHITLGLIRNYSNNEDKIKAILNKFCEEFKPLQCSIRSVASFEPSKSNEYKYVLYAQPEVSDIDELHGHLFSMMKKYGIKIDNGDHDFSPHVTIKYCEENPEDDLTHDLDQNFILDKMTFAIGNKKYRVGLG